MRARSTPSHSHRNGSTRSTEPYALARNRCTGESLAQRRTKTLAVDVQPIFVTRSNEQHDEETHWPEISNGKLRATRRHCPLSESAPLASASKPLRNWNKPIPTSPPRAAG